MTNVAVKRNWVSLIQSVGVGDQFMRLGSNVIFNFNADGVLECQLINIEVPSDPRLKYDDYFAVDWVILKPAVIEGMQLTPKIKETETCT